MREAKLWLQALWFVRMHLEVPGDDTAWFFAYWDYDVRDFVYAKATFSRRKP